MDNILGDLCPWWAERITLQSRDVSGGGSRNADVFGYVKEASQGPCSSVPGGGVRVLDMAPALPAAPPVAIPAGERFSPYEPNRQGPHKYFLAEAYSGELPLRRVAKLRQLEALMAFTKKRWEDRTERAVPDITSIIGVAGLIFSPGMEPRADILREACAMVKDHAGPLTQRLMQAGRFFVMVLDKLQMPLTCLHRAITTGLALQGQQLAQQGQQLVQLQLQLLQQAQQLASIPEEVARRLRPGSAS